MAGIRKLTDTALPRISQFDYDANSNLIYLGIADIGSSASTAAWRIMKLSYNANGNLTDIKFANGNDKYEYVWNDRVSYSYS